MKWTMIIALLLPLLAACAPPPPPICDREAQEWTKFGTQEDACMPTPVIPGLPPVDDPHDPTPPYPPTCGLYCGPDGPKPPQPPVPPSEPPVPPSEPPAERVKGNNGLGNGDQPAPGGSLSHNKAENEVGNPGHKSGKPQKSD